MATLGSNYLTLADRLKRTENGKIASEIIEMMSETNEVLQDANALQCNDGTNHITTIRTGLPSAVFRNLYGYVPSSKSTTEQVKDVTGMLETYSIVDVDLVDKSENPKLFRLSESSAFIEAMNQKLQETVFYGSIKENYSDKDREEDSKHMELMIKNGLDIANSKTTIFLYNFLIVFPYLLYL